MRPYSTAQVWPKTGAGGAQRGFLSLGRYLRCRRRCGSVAVGAVVGGVGVVGSVCGGVCAAAHVVAAVAVAEAA
jgi:hypothetical protein